MFLVSYLIHQINGLKVVPPNVYKRALKVDYQGKERDID